MTFPILASLQVRLVVLLPFQLLRLSLSTPSRWTPLALSVFLHCVVAFFFFNHTATTDIYTLSLHDALPISTRGPGSAPTRSRRCSTASRAEAPAATRSEEHTSELQSRGHLVCRLLLEK